MSCNSCGINIVNPPANNCYCKPDVPATIPNCRKGIKDSLRIIVCKPCDCVCKTVVHTRTHKCKLPSIKDKLRLLPTDCCLLENCCSQKNEYCNNK